ncbi:glutathione S-transferase [Pseudomonas sp. R2.Fl]|nr:glutathione S-transferase [Pseudomonas sp. R2.Fl]
MKLLYAPASPYSAKVRMAASHLGIEIEAVKVSTSDEPALLIAANPLGKIPTLVVDEDTAIFDSRAIMHFLDRESGRKLYPRKDRKRTEAEVLEALCDGITDCLLAIVYERRHRPEEKVHQPEIDRQWRKVTRGLDRLNADMPKTGKSLHGGHFSLAGLIGYLMLRFPGEWEDGRVALTAWPSKFAKRFPEFHALKPQA